MKALFAIGDVKVYRHTVSPQEQAGFNGQVLHPVCSTFALAQHIEYASRLFVLDMKEPHEEGIGTFLKIEHRAPALVGQQLVITATVQNLEGTELICGIEARVGSRLVATGQTGQRVLPKQKLEQIMQRAAQDQA